MMGTANERSRRILDGFGKVIHMDSLKDETVLVMVRLYGILICCTN